MERLLTLCGRCADRLRDGGYLLCPQTPITKRRCDECGKKEYARNYILRMRTTIKGELGGKPSGT